MFFIGYDLLNEPKFEHLGLIKVNSTTTLHDIYPYDTREYSWGQYKSWLKPGITPSVIQNIHGPLPVPKRFAPVFNDVQVCNV